MLDQRGQLLRAALGFAGLPRPSYDRALWALRPGSTPGPGSDTSPSAWRGRVTTCSLRATTRRAGARPSTRAGWNTRRRARPAPDGSGRHGTRRSGRRGRRSSRWKQVETGGNEL